MQGCLTLLDVISMSIDVLIYFVHNSVGNSSLEVRG